MTALRLVDVDITSIDRRARIVDEASIAVAAGEIVALVGESGSGKTSLGLAALGHHRTGLAVTAGSVRLDGASLLDLDDDARRAHRATRISYVAQHPSAALNPALTVGAQLAAVLNAHHLTHDGADGGDRTRMALESVSLAATNELLASYPHQLSGGQLQRVALALALVADPDVVVLDEPTTGLDAVTRSHVLTTIRRRCREDRLAVLCISHDLAMIADVADRVYVMYGGTIVETGPTRALVRDPAHPYTRHLLAATPDPTGRVPMIGLPGRVPDPRRRPPGCQFAPRCALAHDACTLNVPPFAEAGHERRVRCVSPFAVPSSLATAPDVGSAASADRAERKPAAADDVVLGLCGVSASFRGHHVVRDVALDVQRGEWLAIVGPSGAGKTTLLRSIAGLHAERTGRIELNGDPLATTARRRTRDQHRAIQIVFQHPRASFNPRRTIGQAIARPLRLAGASRSDADRRIDALLGLVALDGDIAQRYPDECSGGELQRAAIARAMATDPQILLCDEITSSLDAVVRAAIVELLTRLQVERGLTIVLVTHDLALAGATSDRIAVMADGQFVEIGSARQVLDSPQHAVTKDQVTHVSRLDYPARGGVGPPHRGR